MNPVLKLSKLLAKNKNQYIGPKPLKVDPTLSTQAMDIGHRDLTLETLLQHPLLVPCILPAAIPPFEAMPQANSGANENPTADPSPQCNRIRGETYVLN
jgi:hypothetical protein